MPEFTTLPISGYNGNPLSNLLLCPEQVAEHLAVVLPGLGYTADMPLLYYPTRLLLERKFDVLQLRPNYQSHNFQTAPKEERLEWMYADASEGLKAALERKPYQKLVLVGKSIGTMGMALLINQYEDLGDPITVWITPLLGEPFVVDAALACTAPSFYMAGTADSTFDPAALALQDENLGSLSELPEA